LWVILAQGFEILLILLVFVIFKMALFGNFHGFAFRPGEESARPEVAGSADSVKCVGIFFMHRTC
jgi:hypothetical protein